MTREGYKKLTLHDIDESEKFIEAMNRSGKPVWIRQVIVPGMMDSEEYIEGLAKYVQKIKNVEKIEFLPFHHLGFSKYEELGFLIHLKMFQRWTQINVINFTKGLWKYTRNLKNDIFMVSKM